MQPPTRRSNVCEKSSEKERKGKERTERKKLTDLPLQPVNVGGESIGGGAVIRGSCWTELEINGLEGH
jgi:hypothetical protein